MRSAGARSCQPGKDPNRPRASQAASAGSKHHLTTDSFPTAARAIEFIFLERQSGTDRINTDTMNDLQTLAADLLVNFRTIGSPRPRAVWRSPSDTR